MFWPIVIWLFLGYLGAVIISRYRPLDCRRPLLTIMLGLVAFVVSIIVWLSESEPNKTITKFWNTIGIKVK